MMNPITIFGDRCFKKGEQVGIKKGFSIGKKEGLKEVKERLMKNLPGNLIKYYRKKGEPISKEEAVKIAEKVLSAITS